MFKSIFFIIMLLLLSCNNGANTKMNQETINPLDDVSKGINVETSLVISQDFQKQIISNGIIEAKDKSDLHFETTSHIASILVKNGQSVIKGQTLAILKNDLLLNQMEKAKIELEIANLKLQEEKINYSLDNIDIPSNILNNIKMKSGYSEALNRYEYARILYNQTFLKAPFDGVIANINTKVGNYISSGDLFCTVINNKNLDVSFSIIENEVPYIKNNQKIEINLFSDNSKHYSASISEINPLIDKNGLVFIKAKIINSDKSLYDGMRVRVLVNQEINNILVIPKEALVLRSNKEVVFTINNGRAKWNYVKKTDENNTSYAISNGLNIGDTIIISGNINLSHDAKVNDSFKPVKAK